MSTLSPNIVCNLKRAHPLIEKREAIQIREFIKEYISKNIDNKRPKLKFNKKLFIKSIISRLENNKNSFFFNKKNVLTVKDEKQKNLQENFKKHILNNNIKLKRASSHKNINEEKDNLNEIYNIKSNKKFIEIEKENNSFLNSFKKNKLHLSAKNFHKINKYKYNNFVNSLKEENTNKNYHNILLIKRNSENFENYKSINNTNSGDKSVKSINSINTVKSNKSIQYSLKGNNFQTFKKNKSEGRFMNRNIKKLDINKNNLYLKINKTYFKKQTTKQDYLRFLEKKSLALRANFIMNNIQNSRGGKQEIRALYNPLNV